MKRALPILFLIAAACASGPNQPATAPVSMKIGSYSFDMGPSPVGVIPSAKLHDDARNKDLEISIEYPTRGGPFPIVVFSHGYGLSDHGYEPLISYWTSNGYVCIRPSHADAGQIRDTSRDLITSAPIQPQRRGSRNPQQQGVVVPLQQNNPAEQIWDREREPQWQNRAMDVELVINSLDKIERDFPELAGKMDHDKIGVSGHGYGAFTALLVGGLRTASNPPMQMRDPRVRAIAAFSPPGIAENRAITAQSFADLRAPVLYMTGTNDRGANESENAAWRRGSFDNSPTGDKYFVLIDGARYASFTGQVGVFAINTPQPMTQTDQYGRPIVQQPLPSQQGGMVFGNDRQIFGVAKMVSLAFWDGYLKNDTSARDLLQPAKLEASVSAVHVSAK
jgi:dienelactone hydrolase